MLVLSREHDQKVLIGDPPNQIEVCVVEIRRGLVRLGFMAPKHIPIHREEVYKAIHAAEAATDVKPSMMDHKGLAGANAEMEMYQSGDHKQIYSPGSKQG